MIVSFIFLESSDFGKRKIKNLFNCNCNCNNIFQRKTELQVVEQQNITQLIIEQPIVNPITHSALPIKKSVSYMSK